MTTDLRPAAKQIEARVLVIGAAAFVTSEPQLAGPEGAYEAQLATIPNHRLVMARNVLHFVMLDDPGFLFETMDRFLTQGH